MVGRLTIRPVAEDVGVASRLDAPVDETPNKIAAALDETWLEVRADTCDTGAVSDLTHILVEFDRELRALFRDDLLVDDLAEILDLVSWRDHDVAASGIYAWNSKLRPTAE